MKKNNNKAAEECGWSDSRYFSFIRSGLRRMWSRYPIKYKVLEEARRPYTGEDKRTKWEYQCHKCEEWFKTKEITVDHIVPCGSLTSYEDLPKFVSTLFCTKDNLQTLCKACHQEKSNWERQQSRLKKTKDG